MDEAKTTEVNKNLSLTKFTKFDTVEDMKAYAQVLLDSKLIPDAFKTVEAVVAAVAQGRELGFEPVTSLNNIHVIQGRATLSVHAIAALIKKAGIIYKLLEDAVYVREDGGADKLKIPDIVYVDRRTTIRFYSRSKDMPTLVVENDISFTFTEARDQALTDKPTWKKMLKIMLRNRTLAIGARFVSPDALLGMYESVEWADAVGEAVLLDKEGNIIQEK